MRTVYCKLYGKLTDIRAPSFKSLHGVREPRAKLSNLCFTAIVIRSVVPNLPARSKLAEAWSYKCFLLIICYPRTSRTHTLRWRWRLCYLSHTTRVWLAHHKSFIRGVLGVTIDSSAIGRSVLHSDFQKPDRNSRASSIQISGDNIV